MIVRKYISKISREELASFVPAALALTIVIVIALFIFGDGKIFKSLQDIDLRQRVSASLRAQTNSPISVLSDDLVPVENLDLVLQDISTELYHRVNPNNPDDIRPLTGLYLYNKNAPPNTKYQLVGGECYDKDGNAGSFDGKCPVLPDDAYPAIRFLEHNYVIALRVADDDGDDSNDAHQIYAANANKGVVDSIPNMSPMTGGTPFR